jgi:hypothetical protein
VGGKCRRHHAGVDADCLWWYTDSSTNGSSYDGSSQYHTTSDNERSDNQRCPGSDDHAGDCHSGNISQYRCYPKHDRSNSGGGDAQSGGWHPSSDELPTDGAR